MSGVWRAGCGAMLACVAAQALAQSTDPPLDVAASLGMRNVDVAGTEAKYREDLNLDDGLRLSALRLSYVPTTPGEGIVDGLELDASDLGGEPFESIHFDMRKHGAYKLEVDRRRSEYFYDDTILPAALASVSGSTGGDFHRFDFERLRDTAELDLDLTPATKLALGLERQTRTGASTTTLAIERDEFELDRPLDETLHALTFGIEHAWNRVTLIVDEQLRDFENTSELFLPAPSEGQNTADAAALTFFLLDQSYDYDSRTHSVRVLAAPTARLDVAAAWRREDVDLDMQASEHLEGTSFAGLPLATTRNGPAATARNVEIADFDVDFALSERVRLIGAARSSTLEQDGALAFGADLGLGVWDIATDGFDVGVEVAVSQALVVAAGWSKESRDVTEAHALNAARAAKAVTTDRDGYFLRLLLATAGDLEITASIEDNGIDDPFALAAPSSSRRYKLGARKRWDNGVSLTASYRRTDADNDASGWLADTEQYDVRAAYRRERLQVSAGYARVGLERRVNQLVTAGTIQNLFVIDYDTASMFRDASARWQLNRRFAIGGDVRTYDTHGSVVLTRDDVRAFVDFAIFTNDSLQVVYRELDYVEDAYDAYDAEILEVTIALAW